LKQFLLPRQPDEHGEVLLSETEAHYLSRVRRQRDGAVVSCCGPDGSRYQMIGARQPGGGLLLTVASDVASANQVPVNQHLPITYIIQALPKGAKKDQLIRQGTEAGAAGFYPFAAARSIPAVGENSRVKADRWRRIAREAFQQSGANQVPQVHEPQSLSAVLTAVRDEIGSAGLGLYCHETALAQATLHEYLGNQPSHLVLVIGPEGGLAPEEIRQLDTAGYRPLFLGPGILRTETVALFAIAAIRMISWEAASWQLRQRSPE
jgi:16S rRNA (uracil1498-N3)-methyltransferase